MRESRFPSREMGLTAQALRSEGTNVPTTLHMPATS